MKDFKVVFRKYPRDVKNKDFKYETGWWNENRVIIYKELSDKEKLKCMIHETFERYLEIEMKYNHRKSHNLSLKLENFIDRIV